MVDALYNYSQLHSETSINFDLLKFIYNLYLKLFKTQVQLPLKLHNHEMRLAYLQDLYHRQKK